MSSASRPFLDPQVVPAARHRRAARAVLVDRAGRVLVERVQVHTDPGQGSWWELPGGGLEGDETTAEAARREIAEETGYVDVEVGPPLATGRVRYRAAAAIAEQHETIHPAWLLGETRRPSVLAGAEAAGLLEVGWLTLDELGDGRRVDPPELPQLARDVLAGRFVPRRLRDRDGVGWSDERPDPLDLPNGAAAQVVGRRVVRDAAPWTAATHAWLGHLVEAGIEQVPRPLGVDAHGREAVTYLDGEVSDERWPEPLRTVEGIAAVGSLLARCAAAAASFRPPAGAVWRTGPGGPVDGQVVAHGDIGHANVVWQPDGQPALIDWEFACPAAPRRDLAEAAALLVPLVDFDHERRGFGTEPDRRARLHALARAGAVDVGVLLDEVARYVRWERAAVLAQVNAGDSFQEMLSTIINFIPLALAFLAILIIGWFVAKAIAKLVDKVLTKVGFDRAIERGGVGRAMARTEYDPPRSSRRSCSGCCSCSCCSWRSGSSDRTRSARCCSASSPSCRG
jgi:8-oxo-dGTP pyrophosphatase MutT (NUDIX family)